jgi:hypothetical protein
MKPRSPPLDEAAIDALYGLDPVIDPAREGSATADPEALRFMTIQCPYCGEPFETQIDSSAGSAAYIEDCQVCCRPTEITLEVGTDGELSSVTARRSD